MGTSKNSKKGSKPATVIFQKKEKVKKEFLYFEVTNKVHNQLKYQQDLSCFTDENGREFVVDSVQTRYGKLYIKVKNN